MEMLAARLYGKGDLRIDHIPVPKIQEDELLLKVKAAAICGTDLRMYRNGSKHIANDKPVVIGHEFSGIISQLGSKVVDYKVGQRVSVAPNIGCGICALCVAGNSHHCQDMYALGVHIDGGFAEYVRIPAQAIMQGNVVPIGECLSFEAAAVNEAFACVYNSFNRYKVTPGDTVVIIGAGAVGLMHAFLCKAAGATAIIINDLSSERLDLCKSIEPSLCVVEKDVKSWLMGHTDGIGADIVIVACSSAQAQKAAIELLAFDGRANFFAGLPDSEEMVEINTNLIHYKQLTITSTTRSTLGQYHNTLKLLSKELINLDRLVTHRHHLKDIKTGLTNALNTVGLKQVIIF